MTKKKKRRWYHQGKIKISKCEKEIEYRSGWEKQVSLMFDIDPEIKVVEYESLRVPYISNIRTGKVKIYLPDFLITYIDGSKKIIEIKRDDRVNTKIVKLKEAAAIRFINGNMHNTNYEIWTKKHIDAYKKRLNFKEEAPKSFLNDSKKSPSRKKRPDRPKPKDEVSKKLFAMHKKCSGTRKKQNEKT
jgi:hypothetical protein